MVLSRCTAGESNYPNGNKPEQTVEHHIITVLPRSGYCLAGDKTAHLVFGSVIHLLHFYIRLSRRLGTEGPFLQLPRPIMEAKTMNDLDHLNRQGIDFWTTRLVNDTKRELVDQTPEHRQCSTAPQTSPEPLKRRLRPTSVDRRADKQDDLDHFLRRIVTDRQSRETRPDEKTLGSTTISRPGSRLRASSVNAHDNMRQPLCKIAKELPSHMDGYASENSVWPATRQAIDSNQSGARSVQLIERLPLPMTDRFQTVRCSAGKTGIYEGEQSEFWRSIPLKNPPRKLSIDSTMDYQNMMSKNPPSQMFNTECARDHGQMPCPPPPRYTPNGIGATVPSCTDSPASQSGSAAVNLWPSRPHRIITGLLCRTLDEHLRSIEAAEHLQSKKHKVTIGQNGDGNKIHYAPVTVKETLEIRTSNPSSDSHIGIHKLVPARHNFTEDHTSGINTCAEKELAPLPDPRKFSSNDPTQQLLEFPTPKSVGRVFVMEAATYSSDDYEFLSETGPPRPFIPPAQSSNQGNYHSEDEKQSVSPAAKGSRLRRAATTREGQRKFPLGSGDDVGIRNRHAMLLDDWDRWKLVNVQQNSQEKWPKNEAETPPQNHTLVDNPATIQSNLKVFFGPQTALDEQPSPKPRTVKTLRTECTLKADDAEPLTAKPNGDDCTSKEDNILSSGSKPTLTLGTTPKSSAPSEADAVPNLRNSRCRRLTADDSERRESTSELGPSPSTSSRASTVFCLPWDSPPFGGYLSDLINLAGGANGSGSRKELVYRRRTMSGLDRRCPVDRLSVGNEPSASSADSQNKAEFQRLLLLWMQTNGNAGATTDTSPGTANDSSFPNHPPVATDNRRTNIPPPIPRRRSRHGNGVRQSAFAYPSDTSMVSDISPYAVTVCPSKSQVSKDRECQSKQKPFQGPGAVDPNEGSDVYDEAFCGNDEDVVRRTDPVPIHSQSSSRIPTPLSKLESTFCGSATSSTTNMPTGDRPPNYVYAQVIPRHLRNHSESDSGSEKKQNPQKTLAPEKSNFTSKFGHGRQQRAYVEIDDAFYADGYGCATLGAGGMPLCSTVDNYYRPNPLLSSKSNSSLSDYSSQSSSHSNLGGESSTFSSARYQTSQTSRSPGRPTEVKQSGWFIRKFLQRLIKDKTGEVAEQIGLFIECTRASSDRGPYRTMQSIRQFINGMTNYLMRNPKLGLSEAVNKEKEQLSDYGFLNVGAILETTLQKYVLRPLHRHVIRQLKREQIRHNELESVRAKIHLARCSPSDSLPPSYGVSVNSRISTHNIQLSSEDYHPIYAWTLARAGLLLAPLIPDPINSDQPCPTKAAFCPAALQADYLDGLLTKSQLSNQAIDQCSLNDLFGTLYWVWSRSTTHPELQRGNSVDHLISNDFESPRMPNVNATPNGGFTSNSQQCAMLPPPPVSMQHPDPLKSMKRRIIPPSRRKTVTTVQHPGASPAESQSGSPVIGSKFDFVSKIPVNTLQRAASKQSVRSYSIETEQAVTVRSGDVEHLSARWRPWAPSVSGSSFSTPAGSAREQPLVRVLVMDEKTNQMRSQFYPVRPSLTASELCNILAFRMKIFDPKEFGLFVHIEGREIPLDDSLRIADFIDITQADVFDLNAVRSNMSTPGSVKDLPLTMNTTNTPAPSASSRSGSPSPLEATMNRPHKPNRSIPCVVAPSWWSAWKRKGVPFSFDRKHSSPNITHDAAELVGQAPTAIDTGMRASKANTKPVMIYRRTSGYFAISDRALSEDNSSMS
ncbi:protein sprint [Clonorchis sinensis]|uniref:Protein sprint n=1 Tax=Clonorchis sinensis TaxID=79923 RepID=G7YGV7_CLOSI|nr:protein sprint [Clonorchis sinensis]